MTRDRAAYERDRRARHRAEATEAEQLPPAHPLLPDGSVDVRALLARWDAWANRGAAVGPSNIVEVRP